MDANTKFVLPLVALMMAAFYSYCAPKSVAQTNNTTGTPEDFAPLAAWKSAVIGGDAAALKAQYSTDPATEVRADGVNSSADEDMKFWLGLKARALKLEIVRSKDRPGIHSIIFHADVESAAKGQTISVTDAVAWQKQGDEWRIRSVERTDAPRLKQPADMKKNIYPSNSDAQAELKEAEEKAASGHKRLLLVFGANWCYDCHVLDLAFQRPDIAPILHDGYEVIHIDLGDDEKKNADLVRQFDIPLDKGIPALAVAESDGKLVVSQKNGEFENARGLTPDVLLAFLNQWKPSPLMSR
ncbi:MAG TPA: thioredoxin family protein [Candidatus Sulfotelmatobacter sp.]